MILYLHFTKSLKRDGIYKLCLWIIEQHSCLILNALAGVKAGYDAHVQFSYIVWNHSGVMIITFYINFITPSKTEIQSSCSEI